MKTIITILGCGSSMGVPRADGFWGKCDPKNKKNYRTRCSLLINKGNNNVLIDTSPDLKYQLLSNIGRQPMKTAGEQIGHREHHFYSRPEK